MKIKESTVVADCIRYLNTIGVFAFRVNNMGTYRKNINKYTFNGLRGIADILGCGKGGKFVAVECKIPGKLNNQSAGQKEFEIMINKCGGKYYLVDSWSMLQNLIEKDKLNE